MLGKLLFFLFQKQPSIDVQGILEICSKFTGKHPCQSVISIKLLCNFIEIARRHERSLVNLPHIFRTPSYKNTYGGLLQLFVNDLKYCSDLFRP